MGNSNEKTWNYRQSPDGETHGPVTEQELLELAEYNIITKSTLIQPPHKGGKWFYASQFKGLVTESLTPNPRVEQKLPTAEPPAKACSNSSLMSCPDCDAMVSKRANSCPQCGCPLQGRAVECRISFSRDYDNTGSVRTSYVFIDDEKVASLETGDTETVITSGGNKNISFYVSGLLGGATLQQTVKVDIREGDHLIIDFNPFGGFFGTSFEWDMSEKLAD